MPVILTPTVPPTETTTTSSVTETKNALGAISPAGAVASGWDRFEPLVTPAQLKALHLFGIPLLSGMRDPVTNKAQMMSDELVREVIINAVALAEAEGGFQIFPTRHQEKTAFDKNLFQSLGYLMLRNRPVYAIHSLTVTPSNDEDVYSVPLPWIDTAYLHRGQINIIPLNIATVGGAFVAASTNSGGAAFFLSVLGQRPWVASWWKIIYTSGWPDGQLPRLVNQYVGTIAAMEILGLLATTHAKSTSYSLGIDSISQSISSPGPQLFQQRMTELAEKRKMLMGKLKSILGLKLFSGEV